MKLLTADEFQATTGEPHVAVGQEDSPPFDFWTYFEGIPGGDFAGHDFSAGRVTHAWSTRGGEFQHILVQCDEPDTFLVLVLDLRSATVVGHHLLDLRQLYGLK